MHPQSNTAYLESNLDSSVRFVTPLNSGSGNVDHMEGGAIETSGNNNDNYNPFSSWSCLLCVILVMNVSSWRGEWSSIEFKGSEEDKVQRKSLSHSMKVRSWKPLRSNRDNKQHAKKRTMNTSHSEPPFAVWGILNHCEWPNSLM